MGCVFTKPNYCKDYNNSNEEEKKYSPSSSNDCNSGPLPLIEPIKTQRIIYEEKIKKIYYIEYNKQNDRRYKG